MNQSLPQTPREWLLLAFNEYKIKVLAETGPYFQLERGYTVEIEKNGVFKLRHEQKVVAPFLDLDELCQFIQLDS